MKYFHAKIKVRRAENVFEGVRLTEAESFYEAAEKFRAHMNHLSCEISLKEVTKIYYERQVDKIKI